MPLAPLKADPALWAVDTWPFESPAPGSGEEAMERALWLARMQQALQDFDQDCKDIVAEINASHRAAKAKREQEPARQPRASDPDYLDGDYKMIGSIQSSDWGL